MYRAVSRISRRIRAILAIGMLLEPVLVLRLLNLQ